MKKDNKKEIKEMYLHIREKIEKRNWEHIEDDIEFMQRMYPDSAEAQFLEILVKRHWTEESLVTYDVEIMRRGKSGEMITASPEFRRAMELASGSGYMEELKTITYEIMYQYANYLLKQETVLEKIYEAEKGFRAIKNYKDSSDMVQECVRKIDNIRKNEEEEKRKKQKQKEYEQAVILFQKQWKEKIGWEEYQRQLESIKGKSSKRGVKISPWLHFAVWILLFFQLINICSVQKIGVEEFWYGNILLGIVFFEYLILGSYILVVDTIWQAKGDIRKKKPPTKLFLMVSLLALIFAKKISFQFSYEFMNSWLNFFIICLVIVILLFIKQIFFSGKYRVESVLKEFEQKYQKKQEELFNRYAEMEEEYRQQGVIIKPKDQVIGNISKEMDDSGKLTEEDLRIVKSGLEELLDFFSCAGKGAVLTLAALIISRKSTIIKEVQLPYAVIGSMVLQIFFLAININKSGINKKTASGEKQYEDAVYELN